MGDELLLRDDSQLRPSKVTNITEVQAAGMYAPVTSSGRLVVNDVLVSSYAVPADLPSWSTVLQQVTTSEGRAFVETAVHRALTPLRMRCLGLLSLSERAEAAVVVGPPRRAEKVFKLNSERSA